MDVVDVDLEVSGPRVREVVVPSDGGEGDESALLMRIVMARLTEQALDSSKSVADGTCTVVDSNCIDDPGLKVALGTAVSSLRRT